MDTKTRLGMKKIIAELAIRYLVKEGITEPTADWISREAGLPA